MLQQIQKKIYYDENTSNRIEITADDLVTYRYLQNTPKYSHNGYGLYTGIGHKTKDFINHIFEYDLNMLTSSIPSNMLYIESGICITFEENCTLDIKYNATNIQNITSAGSGYLWIRKNDTTLVSKFTTNKSGTLSSQSFSAGDKLYFGGSFSGGTRPSTGVLKLELIFKNTPNYLRTNFDNNFTPTKNGDPATKKYVDNAAYIKNISTYGNSLTYTKGNGVQGTVPLIIKDELLYNIIFQKENLNINDAVTYYYDKLPIEISTIPNVPTSYISLKDIGVYHIFGVALISITQSTDYIQSAAILFIVDEMNNFIIEFNDMIHSLDEIQNLNSLNQGYHTYLGSVTNSMGSYPQISESYSDDITFPGSSVDIIDQLKKDSSNMAYEMIKNQQVTISQVQFGYSDISGQLNFIITRPKI